MQEIIINNFRNSAGTVQKISVYFDIFGPPIGTAPIVLVNHALTGNSKVTGENGWWKGLVGAGKCLNTETYTVLCINMPGNGACGKREKLISNYTEFTLHDFARIYAEVLERLKIDRLFAVIGGSIGGALAWELAVLKPNLVEHLIPIATDYKATDWVLAHCKVQDQILNNSADPIHDARMHAMTFYRTPASFTEKFRRKKNEKDDQYEVHHWLSHHGRKLENRFQLAAYKLMNHLLTTIDIGRESGDHAEAAAKITGAIHLITVDSDLFFLAEENREAYKELLPKKKNISISEIYSIHGHDAFLIESAQLEKILTPIFTQKTYQNEENKYSAVRNR